MKRRKYYMILPAFFLVFLADAAIVLGFFYLNIFCYTDSSSLAEIDPVYKDAVVLDETYDYSSSCKYIFAETPSENYYVIVLEKSPFYDRYRYVPDSTVLITSERPFSDVIDVPNNKTQITVDENNAVSYLNVSGTFPRISTTIQLWCIILLLAAEVIIFGVVQHCFGKKKEREERTAAAF